MSDTTPLLPADRFARILAALLVAVASRVKASDLPALPWPVVELLVARIRLAKNLFAALAERVRLGTARVATPRTRSRRNPDADATPAGSPPVLAEIPRRFGVVIHLVGWQAVGCAAQLEHLLGDPEMVALVATAPGFARILRPLLRMLAIVPPPGLFPAAPKRQPRRTAMAAKTPDLPAARKTSRRGQGSGGGEERRSVRRLLEGPALGMAHVRARPRDRPSKNT